MVSLAKDVGKALVPPGIEPNLWWRICVSGTLSFLFVAFLWSVGLFASMGYPGFARADEVEDVKQQVNDVRASLLAKQIDDVTAALCMETVDRRLLDYRRELQNDYRAVKGHEHQSPACEILLKLRR